MNISNSSPASDRNNKLRCLSALSRLKAILWLPSYRQKPPGTWNLFGVITTKFSKNVPIAFAMSAVSSRITTTQRYTTTKSLLI